MTIEPKRLDPQYIAAWELGYSYLTRHRLGAGSPHSRQTVALM
jgi:hypothetical protein